MSNVYYQLYLKDTLTLARTLVFKFTDIAEQINSELELDGISVNYEDPTTWLYYRHLAGEYHSTDVPMTVRSMDTLEEIVFSKENLDIHRATAREYVQGTTFYNALIKRYPKQVSLINGIINPVDIDTAINADNGDILYYNATYVESNELNLIVELQNWIKFHIHRWYNRQYVIGNELYIPAFIGNLFAQLPMVLMNLRMRKVHTNEVHSFHIREHLASNGRLDQYLPYMTKYQQLWLYRNIRYLQRNVGHRRTFYKLVENILTHRRMPLTWYHLVQDISDMPESLKADVLLNKEPINYNYNQTGRDIEQVHTILERQIPKARDNKAVMFEAQESIEQKFGSGLYSELPTKVFESEVVDRTNSSIRSLEHVLANHWAYLASTGRYRAFINITNPESGEVMTMSVRDAFVIALYSYVKSRDIDMPIIPKFIVYDVLRQPVPTFSELKSIIDPAYVNDALINEMRGRINPLGEYISTERFYEACEQLHSDYLSGWELVCSQEHYITRGLTDQLFHRHFQHIKLDLVPDQMEFDTYFGEQGYEITNLSKEQYELLFADVIATATGANLVTRITVAEIQRAMIAIMTQLSSYGVQYLRTINEERIHYLGTPAIRVGDVDSSGDGAYLINAYGFSANDVEVSSAQRVEFDVDDIMENMDVRVSTQSEMSLDMSVDITHKPTLVGRYSINLNTVGLASVRFVTENNDPDNNHLGHYQ